MILSENAVIISQNVKNFENMMMDEVMESEIDTI